MNDAHARSNAHSNPSNPWPHILSNASRYFEAARHPGSGLIRHAIDADANADADDTIAHPANFTSILDIAHDLHFLIAVAAGDVASWLSAGDARALIGRVLTTLDRMQPATWHGFYYPMYRLQGDAPRQAHRAEIVSTAENGILCLTMAALVGALSDDAAAGQVVGMAEALIDRQDFARLYDADRGWLRAGQTSSPHLNCLISDTRAAVLFAVLRGQVPEQAWTNLEKGVGTYVGSGGRSWRLHIVYHAAPLEYWSPLIYFDELTLSPGLAKTHRNALAVHMDAAQRRGCWAFPEVSMILRGAVAQAEGEPASTKGTAEESEVSPYNFVAPYSLALGAMVDPEAMADWAVRMAAAYPHVNGPLGWRDWVQPQSGRVSPKYLAWSQGLIVSSLLAHHIRRYLHRYWTAPQQATLARLYAAVADPEDVAMASQGRPDAAKGR